MRFADSAKKFLADVTKKRIKDVPHLALNIGGIMYRGFTISIVGGYWVAMDRGSVIACERSKEAMFEAVDALFGK